MDKSRVKVQINSKEALDRFIGEDPELKIQVKEAVLEGFMKSYIKSIVNDDAVGKITQALLRDIRSDGFGGILKTTNDKLILTPETKESIKKFSEKFILDCVTEQEELKELVKEELKTVDVKMLVQQTVITWLNENINIGDIKSLVREEIIKKL